MAYKHLKDFLEQANQKAFWILTYGNAAGLVLGLFAAHTLLGLLPALPGAPLYLAGLLGGLAVTWVRQGQPAYLVGGHWARFQARRLLARGTLDVDSRAYYRRQAAPPRPFALAGGLSYSGETDGRGRSGRTRGAAPPVAPVNSVTHLAPGANGATPQEAP